jgi:ankyrin repeat protein
MFGGIRDALFGSSVSNVVSAINEGNTEAVRSYLRKGGDPNAAATLSGGYKGPDIRPRPLVIWACTYNNREALWALLNAGANPNTIDPNDRTAIIHKVALWNDIPLMKRVLELGADPEGGGGANASPLYIAAARNNLEVAQLLIDAGADPNKVNWGGVTPLEVLGAYDKGQYF